VKLTYNNFLLWLLTGIPEIKRLCLHATAEGSTAVVEYANQHYVLSIRPVKDVKYECTISGFCTNCGRKGRV